MTAFSSGKHEKLTADPTPVAYRPKVRRYSGVITSRENRTKLPMHTVMPETYVFEPRAEFDRPLTNPTNPILAAMRTDLAAWHDRNAGIRWWLKDFDVAPWVTESRDPAQVANARAVLTRLAALGGAS